MGKGEGRQAALIRQHSRRQQQIVMAQEDAKSKRRNRERLKVSQRSLLIRRLKLLYIPTVAFISVGLFLTLGSTVRSLSEGTIFWEERAKFTVAGPIVLSVGVMLLFIAVGIITHVGTQEKDQTIKDFVEGVENLYRTELFVPRVEQYIPRRGLSSIPLMTYEEEEFYVKHVKTKPFDYRDEQYNNINNLKPSLEKDARFNFNLKDGYKFPLPELNDGVVFQPESTSENKYTLVPSPTSQNSDRHRIPRSPNHNHDSKYSPLLSNNSAKANDQQMFQNENCQNGDAEFFASPKTRGPNALNTANNNSTIPMLPNGTRASSTLEFNTGGDRSMEFPLPFSPRPNLSNMEPSDFHYNETGSPKRSKNDISNNNNKENFTEKGFSWDYRFLEDNFPKHTDNSPEHTSFLSGQSVSLDKRRENSNNNVVEESVDWSHEDVWKLPDSHI